MPAGEVDWLNLREVQGEMRAALVLATVAQAAAFTLTPTSSVPSRTRIATGGVLALRATDSSGGRVPSAVPRRALLACAAALPFLAAPREAAAALPFGLGEGDGSSAGWGEAQKAGVRWGGGFSNPLSGGGDQFQAELVNGKVNAISIHA